MQKLTKLSAAPAPAVHAHVEPRTRGVSMSTLFFILAATVMGVAGQLLLKQGMSQMGPLSVNAGQIPTILFRMATTPFVIGGLLVYVSGTFFWLVALSRVDLSYVYPFASLSYVLIFFASWFLLHEQVSLLRVMGMLVICAGVLLVARS